jgi:hypothetical protein
LEDYTNEVRAKKLGFFDIKKLALDDDGYIYVFWGDHDNGCVWVCDPGLTRATFLDIGTEKHEVSDIVYNKETGGVVVRNRGPGRTLAEPDGWYVELRKGDVVRRDLPPFYMDDISPSMLLQLDARHATIWSFSTWPSEDRTHLTMAAVRHVVGFGFDARAPVRETSLIGYSDKSGWVFDIELETGQRGPNRMVLFYHGGYCYGGHLVPPFRATSDKLVGQDGNYYEFAFLPDEPGLHIYRARKVVGNDK